MHRQWRFLVDSFFVFAFLALVIGPWGDVFGRGMSLTSMLQPPSQLHPLGTDNLGRDLLVRCADAIRGAVLPLWAAVGCATVLGFCLALFSIASERRGALGVLSIALQATATLAASIPVGIAAFMWAVLSEQAGLWPVLFAVSALFLIRVYLQTMDLYRHDKNLCYWEAHRALGGTTFMRLLQYGLRDAWKWRLADGLGFHLRAAVAIEASLSYLGFGIQEPKASFGNMLASHFDVYLKGEFYSLVLIVAMLALTAAFPGSLVALMRRMTRLTQRKTAPPKPFEQLIDHLKNPELTP